MSHLQASNRRLQNLADAYRQRALELERQLKQARRVAEWQSGMAEAREKTAKRQIDDLEGRLEVALHLFLEFWKAYHGDELAYLDYELAEELLNEIRAASEVERNADIPF